jgi:hypothetical protein
VLNRAKILDGTKKIDERLIEDREPERVILVQK